MRLVEKNIIKRGSELFKKLDNLCFLSKNLYNSTLYEVRQYFFVSGEYLSYYDVNKMFTASKQQDYKVLPAKVSKMTQQMVDKAYKSFFGLLDYKKKHPEDQSVGEARPPYYLEKLNGRQIVHYGKQALSFVRPGYVKLSKTDVYLKTQIHKNKIDFVRLVPHGDYITIEVGYRMSEKKYRERQERYASIDIGVDNLATVTSNVFKPFIISGKPVKSINQYFNKTKAKLQSQLQKENQTYDSHHVKSLSRIRHFKIDDYFHKASRLLVNYLVSNRIDTLVIGQNKGWKQSTNMGKKNNQEFVQIPFLSFIWKVAYKCQLEGIRVEFQDESYTSKSSFLSQDPIPDYGDENISEFSGKRLKRGLYKDKKLNRLINADVNGSFNILRKFLLSQVAWNEKLFSDCVEVCSTPNIVRITPGFS